MPSSRRFKRSSKSKNKNALLLISVVAIVAVVLSLFFALGQGPFSNPSTDSSPTPSPTATPLIAPNGEYSANGTRVLFVTSMGDVIIQLRDDKPITTSNFVDLVNQGYYTNTLFHRVLANFIIVGGDPTGTGYGDSSMPKIPDEIGNDNRNERGTIAMVNDGEANSSSTQFFFNLVDNGATTVQNGLAFDAAYSVFGKVIQGMQILDAMAGVSVTADPYTGEPSRPIVSVVLFDAVVLS
jgi:peptidylprolyl isomerase